MSTPINQIQTFELSSRLDVIMKQAYFRRSRQLPANIGEMVEAFKSDLLKHMPTVPIEIVDEAISLATLHEDAPLSISFFFQAVRKKYTDPFEARSYDRPDADLSYWEERLDRLTRLGFANSPQAAECRDRINHLREGDKEIDTIGLLDMNAHAVEQGKPVYYLPRRMYSYLVLRGQLDLNAFKAYTQTAKLAINEQRHKQHDAHIDWAGVVGAAHSRDLETKAMQLAINAWLQACNAAKRLPSDYLVPTIDEKTYQDMRRVNP